MSSDKDQYRDCYIENDLLYWKKASYPIASIAHLIYLKTLTKNSVNFIPVGQSHSATLFITFDDNEEISLTFDESTMFLWLNRDKSKDLSNLQDLFIFLSAATFEKRMSSYLQQVEQRGYFTYFDCKFYPQDKIVYRNREFKINSTDFLLGPGYIDMRNKAEGVLEKLIRLSPFQERPHFPIGLDRDVIFVLLERCFGLTWPKETN
ncbi:MAG: hypothetical protein KA788_06545 [Lacunisphaera sp.]|jgi:hypothetical protein|nr:hypothetical protein [Lacunisphaera sp.]